MKLIFSIKALFLIFGIVPILLAGCGTFEVGIETIITPTSTIEGSQSDQELPPTEISPEPSEVPPTETTTPPPTTANVPDLVSIGHLVPFASMEIGVLTLKDGQLNVDPSPVNYGIWWDYSPQSGGLAYSSEFFHPSVNNNLAVSDLWVYDYQTGMNEKWMDDNVTRAAWAPDGEHITAAVYNPDTERIELVLVSGPDQVEVISECASELFSWSPTGDRLAYVNALAWLNFGVDETCLGTYLVSFPNGPLRGGAGFLPSLRFWHSKIQQWSFFRSAAVGFGTKCPRLPGFAILDRPLGWIPCFRPSNPWRPGTNESTSPLWKFMVLTAKPTG